jgi:hypothetical protein
MAAANRIVLTEADAVATNLHACSWALAVQVSACSSSLEAAFNAHARPWKNPWNETTVSLVDLRWLPSNVDVFTCAAGPPGPSDPFADTPLTKTKSGETLAFTGSGTRRLLFAGIASVVTGTTIQGLRRRAT